MSRARREDHEVAVAFAKYAKLRYREFQKLKRSQKDCPYCHGKKKLLDMHGGLDLSLEIDRATTPGTLRIEYNTLHDDTPDEVAEYATFGGINKYIHFCPMCGRPLLGDNVPQQKVDWWWR